MIKVRDGGDMGEVGRDRGRRRKDNFSWSQECGLLSIRDSEGETKSELPSSHSPLSSSPLSPFPLPLPLPLSLSLSPFLPYCNTTW